MKISTKGRYAMRMLTELASYPPGEFVSLKEIAERQDISKKYLEQIVPMLHQKGILRTNRGYKGGYSLAKKPSEITAGDILRATEGTIAPVSCLEQDTNYCQRAGSCSTLFIWNGLFETINNYLDGITLQDILDRKKSDGDNYCI